MKKRLLAILMALCIMMLSLVGCESNTEYAKALRLIEQEEYEQAYELLLQVGDYKDAPELLERFCYVPESICAQSYSAEGIEKGTPSQYAFAYSEENLPLQIKGTSSHREITDDYDYDENGRLITHVYTSPDYSCTSYFAYDENGYLIRGTTGFLGQSEIYCEYVYDQNGNVIEMIEYLSDKEGEKRQGAYRYTYSSDSNLIKEEIVRDNKYYTVEYTYDDDGNLTQKATVDSAMPNSPSIIQYTYDKQGNLIKEKGETYAILQTYDANGNLIHREYWLLFESTAYTVYDATYDEVGNLIQEILKSGTTTYTTEYTYDPDGSLCEKTVITQYKGDEPETERTVYDGAGNIILKVFSYEDGKSWQIKATYRLVYMPYELPETFINNVSSLFR